MAVRDEEFTSELFSPVRIEAGGMGSQFRRLIGETVLGERCGINRVPLPQSPG